MAIGNKQVATCMYKSFTGSSLMAALKANRNIVSVECNALQFIHSKLRAVSESPELLPDEDKDEDKDEEHKDEET